MPNHPSSGGVSLIKSHLVGTPVHSGGVHPQAGNASPPTGARSGSSIVCWHPPQARSSMAWSAECTADRRRSPHDDGPPPAYDDDGGEWCMVMIVVWLAMPAGLMRYGGRECVSAWGKADHWVDRSIHRSILSRRPSMCKTHAPHTPGHAFE